MKYRAAAASQMPGVMTGFALGMVTAIFFSGTVRFLLGVVVVGGILWAYGSWRK